MLEAMYPVASISASAAPWRSSAHRARVFDAARSTRTRVCQQLAELSAMFRVVVPMATRCRPDAESERPTTRKCGFWLFTGGASFAASSACLRLRAFHQCVLGAEVAKAYRQHFKPWHEETPRVALAMLAIVAEDEAEAKGIEKAVLMRWALTATGANRTVPTIEEAAAYELSPREQQIAANDRPRLILGDAKAVAARIRETADQFAPTR